MANFHFTENHEYIKEDGGAYFVGISDHAQQELGDITYVELPEPGAEFAKGDVCCTVESVKAVAEVYAPVDLKVVEVNGGLEDAPETVNENPQGDGWMLKVELKDPGALSGLMDQSAYDSMEK